MDEYFLRKWTRERHDVILEEVSGVRLSRNESFRKCAAINRDMPRVHSVWDRPKKTCVALPWATLVRRRLYNLKKAFFQRPDFLRGNRSIPNIPKLKEGKSI